MDARPLVALLLLALPAAAEPPWHADAPAVPGGARAALTARDADPLLRDYDFELDDGLYSTITWRSGLASGLLPQVRRHRGSGGDVANADDPLNDADARLTSRRRASRRRARRAGARAPGSEEYHRCSRAAGAPRHGVFGGDGA